jgi:hypothetical protein
MDYNWQRQVISACSSPLRHLLVPPNPCN